MTISRPILFIGDSVTDVGRREDGNGHLGDGYVRVIAERLAAAGDEREVLNLGVSGDRAKDLRARWSEDVLAHDPQLLSIYVGINDTWRRYDSDDPTSAAAFEADYRAILDAVAARAPRLVLVEPFVVPVTDDQNRWHEDLDDKRAVVARLATEYGAAFVPLQAILGAAAEQHGAAAIADDGVHPTALGHALIAGAWLEAAPLHE
jgi:lysophospholipase L1-like esterase